MSIEFRCVLLKLQQAVYWQLASGKAWKVRSECLAECCINYDRKPDRHVATEKRVESI